MDRVKADTSVDAETKYLKTLLLKLNEKYSGDIGLFNIYFLNHVNLQVRFLRFISVLFCKILLSQVKRCFYEQIYLMLIYLGTVLNAWHAQTMSYELD